MSPTLEQSYLYGNLDLRGRQEYTYSSAEVAELADAHDSKSCGLRPCGFDPHLRHLLRWGSSLCPGRTGCRQGATRAAQTWAAGACAFSHARETTLGWSRVFYCNEPPTRNVLVQHPFCVMIKAEEVAYAYAK